MLKKDLWIATIGEAVLMLAAALIGWAVHEPLIFASLGPTAFEQVETPKRPSARPYNVFVGHVIGVLSGWAAVAAIDAWNVPQVSAHGVPLPRVWTAVLASIFTVLATQLARATQPAALSTTLLVALGIMQSWQEGAIIIAAAVLMICIGEPIRRLRLKYVDS